MGKSAINPAVVGKHSTDIAALKNDLGIVEDGDTATHTIAQGQYVIWHGALYTADAAIASGTTLAASGGNKNLTAVENGGLNALNDNCGNIIAEPGTYTIGGIFTGFNTGSGNYIDFFVPVYFAKSLTVTSASLVTSASIFFGTVRMNLSLPVSLTISKVMKNGLLLEMNYSSTQTQNVQATISANVQLVFE